MSLVARHASRVPAHVGRAATGGVRPVPGSLLSSVLRPAALPAWALPPSRGFAGKKGKKRVKIRMVSEAGTGYFYTTSKNPVNCPDKLELMKHDPVVNQHVLFTEKKVRRATDATRCRRPPPPSCRAHQVCGLRGSADRSACLPVPTRGFSMVRTAVRRARLLWSVLACVSPTTDAIVARHREVSPRT